MTTDTPLSPALLVLDFSHYLSAATCAMTLGALGANVIKVERACTGDDMRRLGNIPGKGSPGFNWANRNKRAVALDLRSDAGLGAALALAKRADVLVENFTTGAMDRLGLGAQSLLEINPRLVYCSISAYGREGPFRERGGFDPVVQAESGLISLNGPAGTGGTRTGTPVADLTAGFLAATGVLAGLLARERTGLGQHVEVSLFDSAIALAALPIMTHLTDGSVPLTAGNASREAAPTDVYQAADGGIYIACPSQILFERLARDVLQAPQLVTDARFITNAKRMAYATELRQEMEAILAKHSRQEWSDRMTAAQIPAGVINNVAEAVQSQEVRSRKLVQWMEHPTIGKMPALAMPFRFSATPMPPPKPAPQLNEHAGEVLSELLGWTPQEIQALRDAGGFGSGA